MDNREQKIANLLSMAARARKIVSGSLLVEQAVKEGMGVYLLIAYDAAPATRERFTVLAQRAAIPCASVMSGDNLGHIIGKGFRAVVVLLDKGFADKLNVYIEHAK